MKVAQRNSEVTSSGLGYFVHPGVCSSHLSLCPVGRLRRSQVSRCASVLPGVLRDVRGLMADGQRLWSLGRFTGTGSASLLACTLRDTKPLVSSGNLYSVCHSSTIRVELAYLCLYIYISHYSYHIIIISDYSRIYYRSIYFKPFLYSFDTAVQS